MRKVAAVFSVLLVLSLGLAGSFVAVTGTVEADHTSNPPTDLVVVNASGGPGVTNTTIQAGVNHATPGDTVFVESGTYDESVVVNTTDITIATNESVTLDGSTVTGPAFNVTSAEGNVSNVEIGGFTIANYETGVSVDGVEGPPDDATLDMRNISVLNNTFRDISGTAVSVDHESGEFERVTIADNTITNASDGVSVSVANGVSTENVTVGNNSMGGEIDGSAVSLSASGSTTLADINVLLNNGSASETGLAVSLQDSASISDLNVTGNDFSAANGDALSVATGSTSTPTAEISNVEIGTNLLNDSDSGAGVNVTTRGSATVDDITVDGVVGNASTNGVILEARGSSDISGVEVTGSLLRGSTESAVSLAGAGGTVQDVTVDSNGLNASGSGLRIAATAGGTVSNVGITNNNASRGSDGLVVVSDGASSTVEDIDVTDTLLNETGGTGVYVSADGPSDVTDVSLDTVDASGNAAGLEVYANDSANVANLSASSAVFGESAGDAGVLQAGFDGTSTATIENVTFTSVGFNESTGTGLSLVAQGGGIDDVSLDTVDARDNQVGFDVSAASGATIANLSTDTTGFGESTGDAGVLQATDATIEDVEFVSTGFNESGGTGLALLADGGTVQDVSLDTVSAQNNSVGLNASAFGSGTISDLSTDTVGFGESEKVDSDAGILSAEGSSATIEDVDFSLTGFNETDGTGLQITATDGEIRNVSLTDVDARNNGVGLDVSAASGATIANLSTDTVGFGESDGDAGVLQATDATIEDVEFVSTGFNESNGTGLALTADDGEIRDVSLDTVTAGNNDIGIDASATGTGLISGISTDTVLFGESNGNAGVFEAIGTDAVIEDLSFESTGFNESVGTGLTLSANDGEIRDVSLDTVLAANNSAGLNATATGSGVIENLAFETVGFNESTGTGLALSANDGEIRNLSLDTVTAGNNDIGIDASATGTGAISGISTDTVLFGESDTDAGVFEATGDAVIEDLSFESTGFNESAGTGLTLLADDGTVQNVSMDTVIAGDNDIGIEATATGTGTISGISTDTALFGESDTDAGVFEAVGADATIEDLAFELTGFNKSGGTGLTLLAEDGTVRNVSLDTVIVSDNTVGANATAAGTGLIRNVSANTVLFSGNDDGLRLGAVDDASIEDVRIERSGLNETTNAIIFDGDGGTYSGVKVFESLIRNNDGAGVLITENTSTEGLRVQRSLIADNAMGVNNRNDTGVFDARNNWWGDSSGPSSASGGDTPYADPVNGKLAIGDGDSVSEGATPGVSNVRFDPAIGGKTRNEEDGQVIDPIAVGEDQNINQIPEFNVEFAGQTIGGPISDFVGLNLWERSVLPLRGDDADAANKIRNPEVVFRTDDGDVSINRDFIKVYQSGESLNVTFEQTTGADTSRFAGTEVQFHAFRANDTSSLSGAFSQSINQTTGEVSVGSDDVEIVELRDLGEIDENGTANVEFTPDRPGEYLFALTTVESGDGFELNDTGTGQLSANVLNDSTVFVGFEAVTVQTTSSEVTPNKPRVTAGERVDFNAQSNLEGDNINHAVLMFDKAAYEERLVVIDNASTEISGNETIINGTTPDGIPLSGVLPGQFNETAPGDTARINVTGFVDGEPFVVSVNLTENGCDPLNSTIPYSVADAENDPCVNDITTAGAIEGVPFTVGVVQSGDGRETVNLEAPTGISFENGNKTFQWVHAAVSGDNTLNRSTDVGTLIVQEPAEPDVVVDPESLEFGEQLVGSVTNETVTVTNNGSVPVNLTSISISGQNASEFVVAGTGPTVLAPGDNTTINVSFSPTTLGSKAAQLEIPTNESASATSIVPLSGTAVNVTPAPSIEVDPAEVDFGEVDVGSTATESVTITNTGNATLSISSADISGADAGEFAFVGLPNDTVAPGESTTLEVVFVPNSAGNFSARIDIESNDTENDVVTVNVSATGEPVPAPSIEVDPEQIDFGEVNVGSAATESVTITNTGNATLEVSSVDISEADPQVFTIVSDPSDTVAPGESTTVEVEFAPPEADDFPGQIDIESNDSETGVVTVDLFGTGEAVVQEPSIEVDPDEVDFGAVEVNSTATESVTVTNTGNATLNIDSVSLSGANASEFTVASEGSDTVAPGENTTIEVEFAPEAEGNFSAQIEVESNDSETGVVTVDLSGTGEAPEEPPEPPVVPIVLVTILLILGILAAVYFAGTG